METVGHILALIGLFCIVKHLMHREGCIFCGWQKPKIEEGKTKAEEAKSKLEEVKSKVEGVKTKVEDVKKKWERLRQK